MLVDPLYTPEMRPFMYPTFKCIRIDIPNLGPGLPPVEESVTVPPIELLSVDFGDLASPNSAVGDKGQDISRDLALRKDGNA
uniref:Uncharacterized protein n=1 Tax=Glossina morsitans morsitans TaxID=37546 RepID=A0A1B0FNH9_GLOMM